MYFTKGIGVLILAVFSCIWTSLQLEAVDELTPKSFDALVKDSNGNALAVDFFSPTCPVCVTFAPVWKKVAHRMRHDTRVKFASVNCREHATFCGTQGLQKFPVLRLYNQIPSNPDKWIELQLQRHASDQAAKLIAQVRAKLTEIGPAPNLTFSEPNDSGDDNDASLPVSLDVKASAKSASQRLDDAEVTLLFSLRQDVTQVVDYGQTPLAIVGDKLQQLADWLKLLSQLLPRKTAREDLKALYDFVRSSINKSEPVLLRDWNKKLDKTRISFAAPAAAGDALPFLRLCSTFTCGLWSLFHILTISAASSKKSSNPDLMPSPGETLLGIRNFVENFFSCTDCSEHFVGAYDKGDFNRRKLEENDGKGAAMWLWQQHNSVTTRVRKESGGERWPNKEFCHGCWDNSEEAVDVEIFRYLKLAYTIDDEVAEPGFAHWPMVISVIGVLVIIAGFWAGMKFRTGSRPGHNLNLARPSEYSVECVRTA